MNSSSSSDPSNKRTQGSTSSNTDTSNPSPNNNRPTSKSPSRKSRFLRLFRKKESKATGTQENTVSVEHEPESQAVETKKPTASSPTPRKSAQKQGGTIEENEKTEFEVHARAKPAVTGTHKPNLSPNEKLRKMMKKTAVQPEEKTEFERVKGAKKPAISKGRKMHGLRWKSSTDSKDKQDDTTNTSDANASLIGKTPSDADIASQTLREQPSASAFESKKPSVAEKATKNQQETIQKEAKVARVVEVKRPVAKPTKPEPIVSKEILSPHEKPSKVRRKFLVDKTQADDDVKPSSTTSDKPSSTDQSTKAPWTSCKEDKNTEHSICDSNPTISDSTALSSDPSRDKLSPAVGEEKYVENSISLVPVIVQKRTGGSHEGVPKSQYAVLGDKKKDGNRSSFDPDESTEKDCSSLPPFYQKK